VWPPSSFKAISVVLSLSHLKSLWFFFASFIHLLGPLWLHWAHLCNPWHSLHSQVTGEQPQFSFATYHSIVTSPGHTYLWENIILRTHSYRTNLVHEHLLFD
jgi:hypothetical protein